MLLQIRQSDAELNRMLPPDESKGNSDSIGEGLRCPSVLLAVNLCLLSVLFCRNKQLVI